MNLKPHIWTVDEILELPEFGGKMGWFNGLVKDEGKMYWTEIFPGMGYAKPNRRLRLGIYPSSWAEFKECVRDEKEMGRSWVAAIGVTSRAFYRAVIDIFRYHPQGR
jgi:hypothetical protein